MWTQRYFTPFYQHHKFYSHSTCPPHYANYLFINTAAQTVFNRLSFFFLDSKKFDLSLYQEEVRIAAAAWVRIYQTVSIDL